jgi:hypothetical protein
MKILTARFAEGRLDIPEGSVHEGDVVTLLVPEDEQGFTLTSEERARLEAAIAQAERGEGIDGWKLLDELRD